MRMPIVGMGLRIYADHVCARQEVKPCAVISELRCKGTTFRHRKQGSKFDTTFFFLSP